MTPDGVPDLLRLIRDKVATAAPDMAMAMGRAHERHLTRITLMRSGAHSPASPYVRAHPPAAPAGEPPMTMTGTLRASVTCVMGMAGGAVASSIVGPHTIYAETLEYGAVHTGDMWLWVRFIGPSQVRKRGWQRTSVHIREHPFMRPSRNAVIADGSVVRAGDIVFMERVWGTGL